MQGESEKALLQREVKAFQSPTSLSLGLANQKTVSIFSSLSSSKLFKDGSQSRLK